MVRTKAGQERTAEDYLKLPYNIRVTPDPTGGFVADVLELPGCITQAETWEEAGTMIQDAMRGWIALRFEDRLPVPEPADEAPPAKILVRLPRSLHAALARAAARDGVSVNQFVIYRLALAVGEAIHDESAPDPLAVRRPARPTASQRAGNTAR